MTTECFLLESSGFLCALCVLCGETPFVLSATNPGHESMMHDFANWALETARVRGATYADARVMDIRLRDLSTKNGHVGMLAESESFGIGIRVIARDC